MARSEVIEARLRRWAQYVQVGDGSGYPAVNVLSEDWSPPAPGQRPSMKVVSHTDAGETHRALGLLSMRLRNTVVVVYCLNLSGSEQALRLGCSERTVFERVDSAHRQLAAILGDLSICNLQKVG